jgi:hypothetical protein
VRYTCCEFFQIEYAIGIPANCIFQQRAELLQKRLKRRYRRMQVPQRSFSSFRHRAQLLKLGARVRQTARCLRVHLATGWPFQALFRNAALAFNPG